jgi:hypothetical protein
MGYAGKSSCIALNGADGRELRRVCSMILQDGRPKRRGWMPSSTEITRTSIDTLRPLCLSGTRWVCRGRALLRAIDNRNAFRRHDIRVIPVGP